MGGLKMLGESRADEGVRATKPAELAIVGPDQISGPTRAEMGYEPCFSTTRAAFRAALSLR